MKLMVCMTLGLDATGGFLERYDPEFMDGLGRSWWTHDFDKAMRFADALAALALYRQTPKAKPVREDGKPNRPLTAYTIEIIDEADVAMLVERDPAETIQ